MSSPTTSTNTTTTACSHVSSCPLYPVFRSQALLAVWKMNYCDTAYARCERYRLSCEGKTVPLTLLPNGKHLDLPK